MLRSLSVRRVVVNRCQLLLQRCCRIVRLRFVSPLVHTFAMFFARFPSGTPPNHHGVGRRRCSRLHAVAAGGAGAPAPAPAAPTGPATAPFVPYNAEAARYLPDSQPGMFLDEAATLATSTFPIKPDALIALAKKFSAFRDCSYTVPLCVQLLKRG